MAFVGGFVASGGVGLWASSAPLGALVFKGARAGLRWFGAFVVAFLVSGLVGELASGGRSSLPTWFESTMIALNVTVGGAVVFMLLVQFVRQREEALAALRTEQDRAESLLLNILPGRSPTGSRATPPRSRITCGRLDPVRRCRGLHDPVRPPPAGRGGGYPRPPVLAFRPSGRPIRGREDYHRRRHMVAAGVPTPRADHARVMALMALDMRDAVRSEDEVGNLGLELRIGINRDRSWQASPASGSSRPMG